MSRRRPPFPFPFPFPFTGNPSCASKTIVASLTPNANCTELTVDSHYGKCASCDQGCQCGGTLDCPMPSATAPRRWPAEA